MTGREVAGPGPLEPEAWRQLVFLTGPVCFRCGMPFDIAVDPDQLCGACLAHPPAFDRARAAVAYGDVSREIVLALKYQGRRDGLELIAGWMEQAASELVHDTELIVPVPLHYFRLLRRGFNQAGWLAEALGKRVGKRVSVDALTRTKATPIQGGLTLTGRRRNVDGAFRVRASRRKLVAGKRILLVDDVLTTGATAEACAKALKRAGAACVDVIAVARVAAPRSPPI